MSVRLYVALAGIIAVGADVAVAEAQGICLRSIGTWSQSSIPLKWKLNTNFMDTDGLCDNSACSSIDDVRYTITAALNEFHDATGGKIRFEYAGTTTAAEGATLDGYVHIYAEEECAQGVAAHAPDTDPDNSAKIALCVGTETGAVYFWQSFQAGVSMHQVVVHEMLHVLGLDHPDECYGGDPDDVFASAVRDGGGPTAHLLKVDIDFLHDYYGTRTNQSKRRRSSDALSWSTLSTSQPAQVIAGIGRFAATNSREGAYVYLAHLSRASYRQINVSRYTTTGFAQRSAFQSIETHSHPGIAADSDSAIWLAYMDDYDEYNASQSVHVRSSSDGASTWGSPLELTSGTNERTNNPGVSATHDPASGRYITMWRSAFGTNGNEITYRMSGTSSVRSFTGFYTSDTPNIACSFTGYAGERNCLVVWSDANNWSHVMRYMHCKVSGDQLACFGPRTHGYMTAASPSVAMSVVGRQYEWHIALHQGGTATYTWRKDKSVTANFQDQRSHSFGVKPVPPAAGAPWKWRDWITMHE